MVAVDLTLQTLREMRAEFEKFILGELLDGEVILENLKVLTSEVVVLVNPTLRAWSPARHVVVDKLTRLVDPRLVHTRSN